MKYADLKPDLPAHLFPRLKPKEQVPDMLSSTRDERKSNPNMNVSRRRSTDDGRNSREFFRDDEDEFGNDGLDDGDLVAAGKGSFL